MADLKAILGPSGAGEPMDRTFSAPLRVAGGIGRDPTGKLLEGPKRHTSSLARQAPLHKGRGRRIEDAYGESPPPPCLCGTAYVATRSATAWPSYWTMRSPAVVEILGGTLAERASGVLLGLSRASFRAMLAFLGASWGSLGPPWGSRGAICSPKRCGNHSGNASVGSWGPLGAVLGTPWAVFGLSWGVSGPSWAVLGLSWDCLGAILGHLGALLRASWAVLGQLWAVLGPSGAAWSRLGAVLGPSSAV